MIYQWKCRECSSVEDRTSRHHPQTCICGHAMKRVFSVNVQPTFTPHFNNAVGSYVSSNAQLNDELKKASDAQSAATGIDHNYSRLDPGDMPRPTTDDHAFDIQAKAWRDKRAVS